MSPTVVEVCAKKEQIKTKRRKSFLTAAGIISCSCDLNLGVCVCRSGPGCAELAMTLRSSVGSHASAVALGAVAAGVIAAAAYPIVNSANPQSLAGYIAAICAKTFRPAAGVEAAYLADNVSAMTKMMIDMGIQPSGDVDHDFVAMMVPHHQGAIEMAQAELRYGRNEVLRRLSQEVIVTQQQEILAMRLALGEPLPPYAAAPDQITPDRIPYRVPLAEQQSQVFTAPNSSRLVP
jgi:hypothetical protein